MRTSATLDRVVATTTIRLWIALASILVLLAAAAAWLVVGSIPVRASASAIVTDASGTAVAFVSASRAVSLAPGQEIVATTQGLAGTPPQRLSGTVSSVSVTPSSLAEMEQVFPSEDLAVRAESAAYGAAYRVDISLAPDGVTLVAGQPVAITSLLQELSPLTILFGGSDAG